MDIADYIALGAVFVALIALIRQMYLHDKQSKIHTYLTYTQRYQEIAIHLPIGVEADGFSLEKYSTDEKEEILRWLRAYFDMCSEEFYLHDNELVDEQVWCLWEAGIVDSLKKPAFVKSWGLIQSNKYFHNKFATYIENIINNQKNV